MILGTGEMAEQDTVEKTERLQRQIAACQHARRVKNGFFLNMHSMTPFPYRLCGRATQYTCRRMTKSRPLIGPALGAQIRLLIFSLYSARYCANVP